MSVTPSDEALMLAYRDGDVAAFEILYRRYRGPMYRYLLRQCGSAAVAEELFQDVWMKLIQVRERYQVKASFSTFVYHMAHNRLIDHYRKHKGIVPASYDESDNEGGNTQADSAPSVEAQTDRRRKLQDLLQAISALPEAQREAFLMREESGMSIEEIAEATGVNPETAKSRLRYALNKLRQTMGQAES